MCSQLFKRVIRRLCVCVCVCEVFQNRVLSFVIFTHNSVALFFFGTFHNRFGSDGRGGAVEFLNYICAILILVYYLQPNEMCI